MTKNPARCGWFTSSDVTKLKRFPKHARDQKSANQKKTRNGEKKNMSETETTPMDQTKCESIGGTWNAETSTCKMPESSVPNDAAVMRENEMLKARVRVLEDHLREAIKIANRANDAQQARDDAERENLVKQIVVDSNNRWTEQELASKSLSDIKLIHTAMAKGQEATFASIAAMQSELDSKHNKKPLGTAGAWDPIKKEWVGGI